MNRILLEAAARAAYAMSDEERAECAERIASWRVVANPHGRDFALLHKGGGGASYETQEEAQEALDHVVSSYRAALAGDDRRRAEEAARVEAARRDERAACEAACLAVHDRFGSRTEMNTDAQHGALACEAAIRVRGGAL